MVSWGALLGGHVPNSTAVSGLLSLARPAVKGFLGGHESVDLQQVLLLGHSSDLLFIAVQRALRAWHKWRSFYPQVPLVPDTCFLRCLAKAVSRVGGSVRYPQVSSRSAIYRLGCIISFRLC